MSPCKLDFFMCRPPPCLLVQKIFLYKAWIMLCVQAVAWHSQLLCQALGTCSVKRGLWPLWLRDCAGSRGPDTGESFLFIKKHEQHWSALIVFCVTCCLLACFLSLLTPVLIFVSPPSSRMRVFHVHGCLGMWSMWPLRHSWEWFWWEVRVISGFVYCWMLFIRMVCGKVNWHYWSEPGRHPSCANKWLYGTQRESNGSLFYRGSVLEFVCLFAFRG